jgi:predicted aspartyl protease
MTGIKPILMVLVCQMGLYLLSAVVGVLSSGVSAFTPVVPNNNNNPSQRVSSGCRHGFHLYPRECGNVHEGRRPSFRLRAAESSLLSSSEKEDLLDMIKSMRVKELKAELTERKISTADAFEKEELIKRLYNAKLASPKSKSTTATAATSKRNTDANVIRGELSFVSLESGQSISGTYNSESIQITDADIQPYPTMTIQVVDNDNSVFLLKLLVDTACSGLVLTPSAVQKHNLRSDSRPVVMTGAGGTADGIGATRIDRFTFGYDNSNEDQPKEFLGPLLAAVQDTGALDPLGLDGIIGLSFLSQYACTEIDLDRSEIALFKTEYRPPYDESNLEIVAEGELSPTRLGIWTVDTAFDLGDGKQGPPIKMLVDTGATSTILSWKGLEEGLGLTRTSPEVQAQTQEMGAMGSDNVAMSLTHKIEVDHPIRFGRPRGRSPPPYKGLSIGQQQSATVDIGEIAVVDQQLSADNVGGILGMNVLSKASMIRMTFSGPIPRITLFQKKAGDSDTNNNSADRDGGDDIDNTQDSSPNPPPTTSKVEPENDSDSPTTSAPAPATEETKPRRKKKKRRY